MRWLWERLLASQALSWSKATAKRLKEEGFQALLPALEGLPGKGAAGLLRELLTALVERRA